MNNFARPINCAYAKYATTCHTRTTCVTYKLIIYYIPNYYYSCVIVRAILSPYTGWKISLLAMLIWKKNSTSKLRECNLRDII